MSEALDDVYSESVKTVQKGCDELSNEASKRARQEKNLKRRVYDSLNVLYAVGVLIK